MKNGGLLPSECALCPLKADVATHALAMPLLCEQLLWFTRLAALQRAALGAPFADVALLRRAIGLGAAAARMQSRVALTELLARIPEFTVDEDEIVWADGSYVRRPLSVPFTVTG